MSTTAQFARNLAHFEATFKKAYKDTYRAYLRSETKHEIYDAINKRYDACWTPQQIQDFLSNCFDNHGNLARDVDTDNPVYGVARAQQVRYKHFFSNNVHPNEKDKALSDRTRFVLDAIHMDIVAKLQISRDGENAAANPIGAQTVDSLADLIRPTLKKGYKRIELNLATRIIQTWCLNAADEMVNTNYEPGKGLLSVLSVTVALGILIGAATGSVIPIPGLGTALGAVVGAVIGFGVVAVGGLASAAILYYQSKKDRPDQQIVDSSTMLLSRLGVDRAPSQDQNRVNEPEEVPLAATTTAPLDINVERDQDLSIPGSGSGDHLNTTPSPLKVTLTP
jgi:hypothetical protein